MNAPSRLERVLAVDSASPVVSVALGGGSEVLAARSMAMAHSSEALLRGIDEVLEEAGLALSDLDALVGLRGPGSFTGLRVGLSTLLGLHQALGLPTTAIPTLDVLSLAAPSGARRVAAVVDALRGEWFVKLFQDGTPTSDAELRTSEDIARLQPDCVVGHQTNTLRGSLPAAIDVVEAGELAPLALGFLAGHPVDWDPATLLEPLYLRPPAARSTRSEEEKKKDSD